ncbi:bifunctional diguanylate cyclase/phosphodiesterase [Candidatus Mycobacterium wuenschmannii]|uniref:Bifunctional diguanylate cyclase/phosphodiesterase n=1 Tax=Candidatus Mycobacterium wuenschmannii TaxID=3027808 RepID=A0ABY8VS07_9MYCO|nr:bifunctional diguanylate cyclase/phosphodiesterase [Candidatus Mycobacterium wuenschmannii]WIM85716.1 bifunctional diguanylate cyclase/phosphodiesterase [Candidatus Mycobacterium wuenschmannii]
MSGGLDDLVTTAAAQLMAATAADYSAVSQQVVATLVDRLAVDIGFLRRTDHAIRATILVAEWPPRPVIPDPDPIGVVYFAEADSVFALIETYTEPYVLRPQPANSDYQRSIAESGGAPETSMAAVPLLSGDLTTGTLGFVKLGDREWLPDELSALQAIAALFAQLLGRVDAEEHMRFLANHDEPTGLQNRRALIAHLDERLAEGELGPVAVLQIDVDRLKVINDHLGQVAGDRYVKAFAGLLRETVQNTAAIARFGGDEFVVAPFGPMDESTAEAFAQRVQRAVSQQIEIDGEKVSRTVSIGIAVGEPGVDTTSTVLRRANQALSAVKSAGGREIARFSHDLSDKYAIRNDIELQLEGTIDSGSGALVLHYLPEFDMRTGEVLGTEALVRWQHPTRGLMMPESFISVVESINLAGRLGRLVMRSAFEQFSGWRSRGIGEHAVLRVNVSPVQLVAEGTVDLVAASLDAFGLDSDSVCLEITESVVVQDIDATHKTLAGLKDIGVRIAIDDFGTGYSALAYLKSLPVDTLKIDRGFVRELGTDEGDQAIVRSIMSLADAFNLEVVAEGVETAAAARTLLDFDCYRAQGFLLSRPLEADAMEALLAQRYVPLDFNRA